MVYTLGYTLNFGKPDHMKNKYKLSPLRVTNNPLKN